MNIATPKQIILDLRILNGTLFWQKARQEINFLEAQRLCGFSNVNFVKKVICQQAHDSEASLT
jgi:hypothetical protein